MHLVALLLMLSAMTIAAPARAAEARGSALEDWKTHLAAGRPDTLIAPAPFDSVWNATLRRMTGLHVSFAELDKAKGRMASVWQETREIEGITTAEYSFVTIPNRPLLTMPDCPGCQFTVIHDRHVFDFERLTPTRTRVIVRCQYVGVPRGQTEPMELPSTGDMEQGLLDRVREALGMKVDAQGATSLTR